MAADEKKQRKKSRPLKRKTRERKSRKDRAAEVLRFGKLRAKLGRVKSTCGKVRRVRVPEKLVPLLAIFVNFGTCSIEVTITGVGMPVSVVIPSQAGWINRQVLLHPLPTGIAIECLPTVPGGECNVGYILIW